jgi:hypothetical protein
MDTEAQGRFQRAFDVVRDCGGYVDADIAKIEDSELMGMSVEADIDSNGSEVLTYKHFYEKPNTHGSCGAFGRIILREDATDKTFLFDAYRHPQRDGDAFDYRPKIEPAMPENLFVLDHIETALGRMMLLEDK